MRIYSLKFYFFWLLFVAASLGAQFPNLDEIRGDLREISISKYLQLKSREFEARESEDYSMSAADSERLKNLEITFSQELYMEYPEMSYLLQFNQLDGLWFYLKGTQLNCIELLNPEYFILGDYMSEVKGVTNENP